MGKHKFETYFETKHYSKTAANNSKRGIISVLSRATRYFEQIQLVIHSPAESFTLKYKHALYAVIQISAKPCICISNTSPVPINDRQTTRKFKCIKC